MPLKIVHGDILTAKCDVIVNPTDSKFSGAGGVDYLIHKAAGAELDNECSNLSPLKVGEVAVTESYNIKCKKLIHTMGPIWKGGKNNEETLLKSCYINSLLKASALGMQSIAFPLIASGTFGFPKNQVLTIAQNAIKDYLFANEADIEVFIYVVDKSDFTVINLQNIERFIVKSLEKSSYKNCIRNDIPIPAESCLEFDAKICGDEKYSKDSLKSSSSLEEWLKFHDDNFAVTLLKLIDMKGMTDVECYKKANISRKTFSKINTDPNYKPSKQTVIAFAIALELTLDETNALLKTVGFVLSKSLLFDQIIIYCIEQNIYDIFEIDAILFKYDQSMLAC